VCVILSDSEDTVLVFEIKLVTIHFLCSSNQPYCNDI